MKPRVSIIMFGVDDLERFLAFYRDGLGLPTQGIVGTEFKYGAVAFFDLDNGAMLALWPRTSIARDTAFTVQSSSLRTLPEPPVVPLRKGDGLVPLLRRPCITHIFGG